MRSDFWSGKRVVVTGHSGFKGKWFTKILSSLGAEIYGYAIDNQPGRIDHLQESINGDICDYLSLNQFVQRTKPEIVFHLAAQPLVTESYKDPIKTYMANVMGSANLLRSVQESSTIRCVVNVTTDKVYKNMEYGVPFTEDDVLGGNDPYACSKACSELLTTSFYTSFLKEREIGVATARAGNVIGGGDWSDNRLIPDFFRAFDKGEILCIRYPQAIRPWQHVVEPLWGYLLLAERLYNEPENYSGAWNFGPDYKSFVPVLEIVQELSKYVALRGIHLEEAAHEESTLLKLDSTKAFEKLNWRGLLTIEETLQMTAEWYLADASEVHSVEEAQLRRYDDHLRRNQINA